MGIAEPSKRLEAMPPYKFQELEQQIADEQAGGLGRARWRDADDQQRPLASVLLL